MKTLSVSELKAQFSDVLKQVQQGETFEIVFGRERKPVARIVPVDAAEPKKKREIGLGDRKVEVTFAEDFKMTNEEFINLDR